MGKITGGGFKSIDTTSIDLTDSTFLKSFGSNPIESQALTLTLSSPPVYFPRFDPTLDASLFPSPLPSLPLLYKSPDQEYRTLNDQPDSNLIFPPCLSYVHSSSTIEQDLASRIDSIKNNLAPSFKDIPCKMKISCIDFASGIVTKSGGGGGGGGGGGRQAELFKIQEMESKELRGQRSLALRGKGEGEGEGRVSPGGQGG